jgi:hypothetical protein
MLRVAALLSRFRVARRAALTCAAMWSGANVLSMRDVELGRRSESEGRADEARERYRSALARFRARSFGLLELPLERLVLGPVEYAAHWGLARCAHAQPERLPSERAEEHKAHLAKAEDAFRRSPLARLLVLFSSTVERDFGGVLLASASRCLRERREESLAEAEALATQVETGCLQKLRLAATLPGVVRAGPQTSHLLGLALCLRAEALLFRAEEGFMSTEAGPDSSAIDRALSDTKDAAYDALRHAAALASRLGGTMDLAVRLEGSVKGFRDALSLVAARSSEFLGGAESDRAVAPASSPTTSESRAHGLALLSAVLRVAVADGALDGDAELRVKLARHALQADALLCARFPQVARSLPPQNAELKLQLARALVSANGQSRRALSEADSLAQEARAQAGLAGDCALEAASAAVLARIAALRGDVQSCGLLFDEAGRIEAAGSGIAKLDFVLGAAECYWQSAGWLSSMRGSGGAAKARARMEEARAFEAAATPRQRRTLKALGSTIA